MSTPQMTKTSHLDIAADLRAAGLYDLSRSVAQTFGVSMSELLGRKRTKNLVAARHTLIQKIRALPDRKYSTTEIGNLPSLNPTSVRHAIKKAA